MANALDCADVVRVLRSQVACVLGLDVTMDLTHGSSDSDYVGTFPAAPRQHLRLELTDTDKTYHEIRQSL